MKPKKLAWRPIVRYFGLALTLVVALVAAGIVATLTIDLGPSLKARAEREGSRVIKRPMRIGKLSVKLLSGKFIVEDLRIDGLTAADRPFLTAKRIAVSLAWPSLFDRDVLFDSIEMTDWRMLVETFPNGRHNLPKLTPDGPRGTRRFTTTLQHVRAWRGHFTYEDHGTPWSTVARNLDVVVTKGADYRGRASFSGGTVKIQNYLPMAADMRCTFKIDGGKVQLDRIDLATDGAQSVISGDVDLARWPEQQYLVRSRVRFPRMREIFFANETFSLYGDGEFTGTFHLFKGGRELRGTFASDLAGVNEYRFPQLRGSLIWLPDRFEVIQATSRFYGGSTRFTYRMAPLGRGPRPRARFDASYRDVDLAAFSDFLGTEGMRLAGRASGRTLLEWPLGRFSEHEGEGHVSVTAPAGALAGVHVATSETLEGEDRAEREGAPFAPDPPLGHVPIRGELTYRFGPDWVSIAPSRLADAHTAVAFEGTTAYGERSRIPFHVTSDDWQESDRLLAAVLTAFGSPTRVVAIGGRGEFDGVLLGSFRRPRIEGSFTGVGLRAWDVVWGDGDGKVVIESSYVTVTGGAIRKGDSEIRAEGRFSLGYPRRDRGEEIDARIFVTRRDLADLRHAFELDDYPLEGHVSGEYHLSGRYETPVGFGRMTIENGVAYGEPFERATASLRFEGAGVRLDGIEVQKGGGADGTGGTVRGAAYIAWNGTYSFNVDGRRLAMEQIAAVAYPRAPLSGLMDFSAGGSGSFDVPRYDVKVRISDLFVADEGIGEVTGRLGVRGTVLNLEVEAASPRLAVSGTGRVSLTPEADAELTFRFADTSLDPYVRAFQAGLSPFTTAVASGTIKVVGKLGDIDQLVVDGSVEQLRMRLFDYPLQNAGPIRLALDRHTVRVQQMRLVGNGTELDVSGSVALHDRRVALRATGSANLGILQGFYRDLRSSGQAELVAEVAGPIDAPLFSGSATLTGGRIRHFSLPHSLDAINGRMLFDARGIRVDGVTAKVAQGDVRFAGWIALEGYLPGELNLTAAGEDMRLRYPEGVRSVVDADLALSGKIQAPILSGTVTVKQAEWTRRLETGGTFFELAGGGTPAAAPAPSAQTLPLQFDVRIVAPGTFRIVNNTARIVSSADLTLRGTYDRPLLFGRAEVERGEVTFEGRRYLVTRGTIDFTNPLKIEPFFDVEAETRVRTPGQTYLVTLRAAGTMQRLSPELTADPPLPELDILSLLFGDVQQIRDAELRALRTQDRVERQLLQARAARLLASPISSEVGRVVEQTFGVDTFQLTPSLLDPYQQSARLNPSARLTIGKRVSDRVYLTFSRSLTASSRDQIILLEYDQTNRLSWILTRNEDETYALDLRVRHIF